MRYFTILLLITILLALSCIEDMPTEPEKDLPGNGWDEDFVPQILSLRTDNNNQFFNYDTVQCIIETNGLLGAVLEFKLSQVADSGLIPSSSWRSAETDSLLRLDCTISGPDGEKLVACQGRSLYGNVSSVYYEKLYKDTYCAVDTFYWIGSGEAPFTNFDTLFFNLQMEDDSLGAETGGTAELHLVSVFTDLPLLSQNNGAYTGSYIVQFSGEVSIPNGLIIATFKDRAGNEIIPLAASNTIDILVIEAPTNLNAVYSSAQINLSWDDNSGIESGYIIERRAGTTGAWNALHTNVANDEDYQDTNLAPNTTYYYRVKAFASAGASAYSNTDYATTAQSVPNATTNLYLMVVSPTQINLFWDDNSTNEDGFSVQRKIGPTGYFSTLSNTNIPADADSFCNTGLTPNTNYYYRVCAFNSAGNSAYSNEVGATTPIPLPEAPSNLTATASWSTPQISLDWTDNSGYEEGFVIERALNPGSVWTKIDTNLANDDNFTDYNLLPNTIYYYRVYAYNDSGDSDYSNVASTTTIQVVPTAPTNLTATLISPLQVNLNWDDNSTNEAGFKIERKVGTSSWNTIDSTTVDEDSLSNTGLNPNTIYYYRVRAYNSAGNSGYSNEVSVTTPQTIPPAPSNLTVSWYNSALRMDLNWSDNSGNESGFIIERRLLAEADWDSIGMNIASDHTFSDDSLNLATYFYRVCAYNSAGNSAYSNEAKGIAYGILGTCDTYEANGVAVSGDYAYIADGTPGLKIIDVSIDTLPYITGYCETSYALDVVVSGNYAYVTDGSYGLAIINISNLISPTLEGTFDTNYAYSLVVQDSFAYIADGSLGLKVIDISNPTAPTLRGSCDTDNAQGIALYGNYAFVADGYYGLRVIDISNPSAPAIVYTCFTDDANEVVIAGNYAYVADGSSGLRIINISNPLVPYIMGTYDTYSANDVAVSSDYAYVANGTYGLYIFNIENKANPVYIGSVDTDYAQKVVTSGDKAYVADDNSGLRIIYIGE